MIKEFADRFISKKDEIRKQFKEKKPESYDDIIQCVLESIKEEGCYNQPTNFKRIDYGDYQGDYFYVVADDKDSPMNFWTVIISYGSCSGCDTLEKIKYDSLTEEEEINDYIKLALHVVQKIKKVQ